MVKPYECTKQFCILQLPISYCVSLIMVTITRHIFINIFKTEHFSAVRFGMGCERNMSFLVISKSPKVWGGGKKVEKIGLGSFKPKKTFKTQQNCIILYLLEMFRLMKESYNTGYSICVEYNPHYR